MAKRGSNVSTFPQTGPTTELDREDDLLTVEEELFGTGSPEIDLDDLMLDDDDLRMQQENEAARAQRDNELMTELTLADYTLEYGGRVFVIEEPDMDMLTALVRFFSKLALRGEQVVGRNFKGLFIAMTQDQRTKQTTAQSVIPVETTLFSILSALQSSDVQTLGVLVLFGGSIDQMRDGDAWFKQIGPKMLKFNVIVKALAYRIMLSEDLALSLKNFDLVRMAGSIWTTRIK